MRATMSRRQILASALISVLTTAPLGAAMAAEVETSKVSYGGSSWLGHYPVWIGIKKGFFEKRGLSVDWKLFGTSSARMGALAAGDIEFAGTGSISALALMAAGSKAFYVVAAPESYATVEGIIATPEIKTINDLKGKKLGVTFASSSHVLVLDVLEQAGLDPSKDVTLINLPASDTPSAFKAKQVDAVATWTPAFNVLRAQENAHVLLDDREFSLYKQYQFGPGPDVLTVSRDFADENPKATAAFLEAFFEASDFITREPAEAASLLQDLTQLPLEEQSSVLKDIEWTGRAEQQKIMAQDGAFPKGLQALADFLVRHKQIDKAPKVEGWIKTQVLP